jgi:hypothetical protein
VTDDNDIPDGMPDGMSDDRWNADMRMAALAQRHIGAELARVTAALRLEGDALREYVTTWRKARMRRSGDDDMIATLMGLHWTVDELMALLERARREDWLGASRQASKTSHDAAEYMAGLLSFPGDAEDAREEQDEGPGMPAEHILPAPTLHMAAEYLEGLARRLHADPDDELALRAIGAVFGVTGPGGINPFARRVLYVALAAWGATLAGDDPPWAADDD